MTTANTNSAVKTPKSSGRYRLPDPPPREPDEMTSYDHVHRPGNSHHLIQHLGNPETTLVVAERWIVAHPDSDKSRARRPDLMIAFGVDPALYQDNNGYIVSEQGKPPDFVLEVASVSTAHEDVGPKRAIYEDLGILEYWRFDETGDNHGARLAGERLVNGRYTPIDVDELPGGVLQGYSAVLNLHLRWDDGRLGWHDPATGQHIATFDSERQRADTAEARADTAEARAASERQARIQEREGRIEEHEARAAAEAERNAEREARLAAEARVRELEELLGQQNP